MMTLVVTPQLVAEFEEATPAEWGLGRIEAAVAVGDPKFGTQGAHLDYTAGATRAQWQRSQITASLEVSRFIFGVWIKHDSVPAWAAASQPNLIAIHADGIELVTVCMLPSGGGLALVADGDDVALAAPTAGVWEFWEIRGCFDSVWTFSLRRDGVDAGEITTALTAPVRITTVGIGSSLVAAGADVIDFHADRMWWWGDGPDVACAAWWSDVAGLDGVTPAARIIHGTVGPEPFAARLGSGNTAGGTMHILADTDQVLSATIQASDTLDTEAVTLGVVLRDGSSISWGAGAWTGSASTTRVATRTVNIAAGIYEVWARLDSGTPVLCVGDLIAI